MLLSSSFYTSEQVGIRCRTEGHWQGVFLGSLFVNTHLLLSLSCDSGVARPRHSLPLPLGFFVWYQCAGGQNSAQPAQQPRTLHPLQHCPWLWSLLIRPSLLGGGGGLQDSVGSGCGLSFCQQEGWDQPLPRWWLLDTGAEGQRKWHQWVWSMHWLRGVLALSLQTPQEGRGISRLWSWRSVFLWCRRHEPPLHLLWCKIQRACFPVLQPLANYQRTQLGATHHSNATLAIDVLFILMLSISWFRLKLWKAIQQLITVQLWSCTLSWAFTVLTICLESVFYINYMMMINR